MLLSIRGTSISKHRALLLVRKIHMTIIYIHTHRQTHMLKKLCARTYSKHSTKISTCSLYNNLRTRCYYYYLCFIDKKNSGTEKLINLPKVTQLISGEVKI